MSVFLIAGESVEKVTRLTSFAYGVLQLTGKFVRSSNFFKWSSDRVLLKASILHLIRHSLPSILIIYIVRARKPSGSC